MLLGKKRTDTIPGWAVFTDDSGAAWLAFQDLMIPVFSETEMKLPGASGTHRSSPLPVVCFWNLKSSIPCSPHLRKCSPDCSITRK